MKTDEMLFKISNAIGEYAESAALDSAEYKTLAEAVAILIEAEKLASGNELVQPFVENGQKIGLKKRANR